MANPIIEYVIAAIETGKSVIEIIRELKGKKISAEERWYIDKLLNEYQVEKQTRELRQESITNHLTNLEKGIEKYYGKIEGLIEGLLLGRDYQKRKNSRREG